MAQFTYLAWLVNSFSTDCLAASHLVYTEMGAETRVVVVSRGFLMCFCFYFDARGLGFVDMACQRVARCATTGEVCERVVHTAISRIHSSDSMKYDG